MEDLLDFLHGLLPSSWFEHAHASFGLSDYEIAESVQEASDFFNMEAPMLIREDWTTGVMTGMPTTEHDDILIFNREQLHNMGIEDKEGFDLVMTHEGAHRALQDIDTKFSEHQEELCCDYMAGVRAGLNGLDAEKLIASLRDCEGCESHPEGTMRVQAIEQGVAFAHSYMEAHNDTPPSFSDCLENYEQSEVYKDAAVEELKKRVEGTDRGKPGETIKYLKMCPTRHGCQGATYCDNSYGDYPK